MNGDSKYRLFRNFMVNELQIARADIIQWVNEAIDRQVAKLIADGAIDINAVIANRVDRAVMEIINEQGDWNRKTIRQEIADRVVKRIEIQFKTKE